MMCAKMTSSCHRDYISWLRTTDPSLLQRTINNLRNCARGRNACIKANHCLLHEAIYYDYLWPFWQNNIVIDFVETFGCYCDITLNNKFDRLIGDIQNKKNLNRIMKHQHDFLPSGHGMSVVISVLEGRSVSAAVVSVVESNVVSVILSVVKIPPSAPEKAHMTTSMICRHWRVVLTPDNISMNLLERQIVLGSYHLSVIFLSINERKPIIFIALVLYSVNVNKNGNG